MKRILSLTLAVLFFNFPSIASGQTNTVTLTSYYPAPFGAYDRLRLVPRASLGGTCTAAEEGTVYIDNTSYLINQCRSLTWSPLSGGVWQMKDSVAIPGRTIPADQYIPTKTYAADLDTIQPYVGIGTNDPQAPLHIVTDSRKSSGAPAPSIRIQNLSPTFGSQTAIIFSGKQQDGGGIVVDFASIKTTHNITQALNLTSSLILNVRNGSGTLVDVLSVLGEDGGKVGIRNATPAALLSIRAGDTDYPYLHISDKFNNNGNIFTILSDSNSGRVGINKVNPSAQLEVGGAGDIKAATLILTSDAGLKKDIAPVTNALDKISRLNGVTFEWKDNPKNQRKHMGVLAQDVEKIFPEVVYGEDGSKGVDYPSLIAPLIEAVKELKTKNEVLSQQLQAQSAQIREQQQKIESLQNSLTTKEPALAP